MQVVVHERDAAEPVSIRVVSQLADFVQAFPVQLELGSLPGVHDARAAKLLALAVGDSGDVLVHVQAVVGEKLAQVGTSLGQKLRGGAVGLLACNSHGLRHLLSGDSQRSLEVLEHRFLGAGEEREVNGGCVYGDVAGYCFIVDLDTLVSDFNRGLRRR